MNKRIITVLLTLATMYANAQNKYGIPVKPWELELRVGATMPLSGNNSTTAQVGPALGAEVRYNPEESPFSIGAKMEVTVACKDITIPTILGQPEETLEMGYRTINFSVLGDYNFRQGRNVNPFVGLGLGIGMQHYSEDAVYENDGKAALAFTPRAGVELFRHVRITCTATLTKSDYSNIGLTLGYVFGGGKK